MFLRTQSMFSRCCLSNNSNTKFQQTYTQTGRQQNTNTNITTKNTSTSMTTKNTSTSITTKNRTTIHEHKDKNTSTTTCCRVFCRHLFSRPHKTGQNYRDLTKQYNPSKKQKQGKHLTKTKTGQNYRDLTKQYNPSP